MAAGDIFYARIPIIVDTDAAADTALQNALTGGLLPTSFDVINSTVLPPTGTRTKAILVIVARQAS